MISRNRMFLVREAFKKDQEKRFKITCTEETELWNPYQHITSPSFTPWKDRTLAPVAIQPHPRDSALLVGHGPFAVYKFRPRLELTTIPADRYVWKGLKLKLSSQNGLL